MLLISENLYKTSQLILNKKDLEENLFVAKRQLEQVTIEPDNPESRIKIFLLGLIQVTP